MRWRICGWPPKRARPSPRCWPPSRPAPPGSRTSSSAAPPPPSGTRSAAAGGHAGGPSCRTQARSRPFRSRSTPAG
ncbi:hypothetical protein B6264_29910 (plasmid) [Kitasatospora aureofaciens]|nr:hypothetical protein B6264_29910 [Kitasatospora aureofaciens]